MMLAPNIVPTSSQHRDVGAPGVMLGTLALAPPGRHILLLVVPFGAPLGCPWPWLGLPWVPCGLPLALAWVALAALWVAFGGLGFMSPNLRLGFTL